MVLGICSRLGSGIGELEGLSHAERIGEPLHGFWVPTLEALAMVAQPQVLTK